MTHQTLQGHSFYVDDADDEFVSRYKWSLSRGYVRRTIDGEKLHRLLFIPKNGLVIDHIDRNKLNNSRSNLRYCTRRENLLNSSIRSDNTTGYKGVTYKKPWNGRCGSYQFTIWNNGKRYIKSGFKTPTDAFAGYLEKAKELHGEFVPDFSS
jgi:hypothetical protein